jgi:hypothetical protein
MRSTIFDSSANENRAAAEMLKIPAIVVVSRIRSSVELILSPGVFCFYKVANYRTQSKNSVIPIKKRGNAALFRPLVPVC